MVDMVCIEGNRYVEEDSKVNRSDRSSGLVLVMVLVSFLFCHFHCCLRDGSGGRGCCNSLIRVGSN